MHRFPQDRSHREREERLDQLASRELASPTLLAIWNLTDALRAIEAAERILAGLALDLDCFVNADRVLGGRSPEEARVAARARFAREYTAAVAGERLAVAA